ncbi:MAG: ankyrin repeat domain-containing protein [Akkermansia sp.]|nr:ankyrin repeat domain-containing protein [Akkermansia sp.]
MDIYRILELAFSLLGVFAALLWMKPAKPAAARFSVIVLSFAGLCYIIYLKPGDYGIPVLRYLACVMPLFTFLLGKYMLRLPWRLVFLSLGVYALVSQLVAIAYIPLNLKEPGYEACNLIVQFGFYLELLWAFGVIWLFTRKDARIRPFDRILTVAAMLIVYKKLALCLMACGTSMGREMLAGSQGDSLAVALRLLLSALVQVLLLVLCYVGCIRYVLQQSWKRSIYAVVVAMVGLFGVVGVYYHTIHVRAREQMRLTQSLLSAIEVGNQHEVELCLLRGVDVNVPDYAPNDQDGELSIFYPLIHATARNHVTMVKSLLEAGADVGVRRSDGDTALLSACIENNPEMIQLLLEAGSDINARNNYGYTPLIQSVMFAPSKTVVEMLLQAGADVNTSDHEGVTALHYAALPNPEARPGALGVMRLLLENGAQVNAQDVEGDTPLLQCARDGFIEGVRLLLEHKADPALRDKKGVSPLEHAEQNGHAEIAELLRSSQHGL